MSQIQYSFNINALDPENGEYLQLWSEMSVRPSKLTIYVSLNSDIFWAILKEKVFENVEDKVIISEIFRNGEDFVTNSRHFFKIKENLYMSFVELEQETFSINALHFYFNPKNIEYDEVMKIAFENFGHFFQDRTSTEEIKNNVYLVGYDKESFDLTPIEVPTIKIDTALNYGSELYEKEKTLLELLNSNVSGLFMLYGLRGCGKTHYLKKIVNLVNKKFYYFPVHFLENVYIFGNFINFIKKQKNPILILEDSEYYFSNRGNKQLIDLLLSNLESMIKSEDLQIILTLNIETEDQIDEDIVNNNCTLFKHNFDKISEKQANKLAKKLNSSKIFNTPVKLSSVYNLKNEEIEKKKPGY